MILREITFQRLTASGFAVFAALGNMAHRMNVPLESVATSGKVVLTFFVYMFIEKNRFHCKLNCINH